MRKALLFLLYLFIGISLFASITLSDDIPDDIGAVIVRELEENIRGRDDIDFNVDNFSMHSEDNIRISFDIRLSSQSDASLLKLFHIECASRNDDDLEKAIAKEIENTFFYEDSLYLDSDEILDYIYANSFSFFPENYYRRGTTIIAKDFEDKTRGVFEVKHKYEDVDELQPIYLSGAKPGLKLERASSWRYSLYGATNFKRNSFAIGAEIGNTSLIYPFIPIATVLYENTSGYTSIYGGIGIESYVDLNDFLNVGFSLIQEGRIGASVSLLLGYSNMEFSYNGLYSVYYEHRVLPKLLWRIGYAKLPNVGHSFIFAIGGSF